MKLSIENINIELNGTLSDHMSDDEFFHFCTENRDLRIERDCNQQIYIMAPTGFETSNFNSDINAELNFWNRKEKKGKVADSSGGFILPDSSVLSPDASWTNNEKISGVAKKQTKKFLPVCPDFVIELKSPTDSIRYLKSKMLKWIENGCELAWLINPEKQEAHIYRSNGSIEILQRFDRKLSGENVLPGFELDLNLLK